jgi:hypothetical protein
MSSSISVPPVQDSVLSQVVRAGGRTVGAIAVVALLVLGVVYGAAPASDAWARVAGDPDLVLADGVTLSSAPESIEVPRIQALTGSEAAAALAPALGGPVEVLTASAAAARYPDQADGIREWSSWASEGFLATPAGLAYLSEDPTRGLRLMLPRVEQAWQVEQPDREAYTRALLGAVGAPGASSVSGVPHLATLITDGTGASSVQLEDATAMPTGFGDRVAFDADGRVTRLDLFLHRVIGSREVPAVSAAEAWDRMRHHSGEWYAGNDGPPVHSSRLVSDTAGVPWWVFLDADGQLVAQWRDA